MAKPKLGFLLTADEAVVEEGTNKLNMMGFVLMLIGLALIGLAWFALRSYASKDGTAPSSEASVQGSSIDQERTTPKPEPGPEPGAEPSPDPRSN